MEKPDKALKRKIEEVTLLLEKQKMKAATDLLSELYQSRPADPKVQLLLGIAALRQHDFDKAEHFLQEALKGDPASSEAHFHLANLYLQRQDYDKAISQYQKVTDFSAHYTTQLNLALAFECNWRYSEAQIIYENLLAENPEDSYIYLHLGNVLMKLLKIKEAIAIYEKGLTFSPKYTELLNQLGVAYFKDDQKERSLKCYHKVLNFKPDNVQALFNMSQQHPFKDTHFPETKIIQEILNSHVGDNDKALCHFALGKIYDVSDFYERAFYHYEKGNSLVGKIIHYNEDDIIKKINNIKSIFTSRLITDKALLPQENKLIFLVGMPRSGKRLLAKALSKNSNIALVGEQKLLACELNKILANPQILLNSTPKALQALANDYLLSMHKLAPNSAQICDVMTDNYYALGLIAILFPQASIVHCTRHPIDLCLANYFYYHHDNGYSHHLVTLGKYYQHYAKLMSYWQSINAGKTIEVKYEDLVQNPKTTVDALCYSLSLKPAQQFNALKFYTYEIERWKKYQHFLQPLIEVLYQS